MTESCTKMTESAQQRGVLFPGHSHCASWRNNLTWLLAHIYIRASLRFDVLYCKKEVIVKRIVLPSYTRAMMRNRLFGSIIFVLWYTRTVIHTSSDTKPHPWVNNICPMIHANSDTREIWYETTSSGQWYSFYHTRELWYTGVTIRNRLLGSIIFVLWYNIIVTPWFNIIVSKNEYLVSRERHR